MYRSLAVLVIAKRFQWQRLERRFLFSEHRGDLTFGGAMNPRIGPAFFPAIQMSLRFFQTLEAEPFQRSFLRMADARLHLAFSIRILNAARHGDGAIMGQDVAVQRVERWIVDVGREHAFAQVVEHNHSRCSTEPPKSPLVQLSSGLRTGPEDQQPNRFAAEAQGQHEQPGAPILPALRIANHRAGTIIHLCFFTCFGENHRACFRRLDSA